MLNIKYSLCIQIIFLQVAINIYSTQLNALRIFPQTYHKIRHLRHLLYLYKNKDNSFKKCILKEWNNGNYSRDKCQAKKCSTNMDCLEEYGVPKLCVCDPFLCGLVCINFNDRCQIPKIPKNGKYLIKNLRVGDKVEYSCDDGYFMKGPKIRYCQANLKHSDQDPECINIVRYNGTGCPKPPNILNAEIVNETRKDFYEDKKIIHITCKTGFEDKNSTIINATCNEQVWQHITLNCQRKGCDKLEDQLNVKTMYVETIDFYSEAIQTCDEGYEIECSALNKLSKNECKRRCEADGRWSGRKVFCKKPRQCQFPKKPINGNFTLVKLKDGYQIQYFCNKGYLLKGKQIRYCQSNLTFSGYDPECAKKNDNINIRKHSGCIPPKIKNTQIIEERNELSYKNKELIHIVCKKGFEDKYNSIINATCEVNVWKYSPLNCRRISCGKLEDPVGGKTLYMKNFEFQSVVIQVCNDGYIAICSGNGKLQEKDCKRICEADGKWSGKMTLCIQILCPKPNPPKNGIILSSSNIVNSVINYKCDTGFYLVGHYLRKCQYNGEWDGPETICKIRDCGIPFQIPFSTVRFNKTTFGAMAIYTCTLKSIKYENFLKVECNVKSGKNMWLPKQNLPCTPYCSVIDISHGSMILEQNISMSHKNVVKNNDEIRISCDYGFELNEDKLPKCYNGLWSYIPKCIEASCLSKPPKINFSYVRFKSLKHNSTARYHCQRGYGMKLTVNQTVIWVTSRKIKCIKGNWTNIVLEGCEPIKEITRAITKVKVIFVGSIVILGMLFSLLLFALCKRYLKRKKVSTQKGRKDKEEVVSVIKGNESLMNHTTFRKFELS